VHIRDHEDEVRTARPRAVAAALAVAALGAVITGCAVGPKFVKPEVALDPAWSEQDSVRLATVTRSDSAWWRAFNDPTLDSLVQLAYQQNLPLQISGLRVMQARAQLAIAVGRQYPQVQAAIGKATAIGLNEHAATFAGVDRNFWDFQVGFDAAWEMDFWGKYRQGVRAEEAQYLGPSRCSSIWLAATP
jgi:outer membrane protein TolC